MTKKNSDHYCVTAKSYNISATLTKPTVQLTCPNNIEQTNWYSLINIHSKLIDPIFIGFSRPNDDFARVLLAYPPTDRILPSVIRNRVVYMKCVEPLILQNYSIQHESNKLVYM